MLPPHSPYCNNFIRYLSARSLSQGEAPLNLKLDSSSELRAVPLADGLDDFAHEGLHLLRRPADEAVWVHYRAEVDLLERLVAPKTVDQIVRPAVLFHLGGGGEGVAADLLV